MSRALKLSLNIAIALIAVLVIAVTAAYFTARTAWFRDYALRKLVSETELATGGKVEVSSFDFDESNLLITIRNFVIHGQEPAGSPPFVAVPFVQVQFRLLPDFRHLLEITDAQIDRPRANVIVLPGGGTNIPTPARSAPSSSSSPLRTVVDLAIRRFTLSNGLLTLESASQPLNLRGSNFRVQLAYNILDRTYEGHVGLNPLYFANGQNTPVNFAVNIPVKVYQDRLDIHDASISTPTSAITFFASLEDLRSPTLSIRAGGHVATADVARAADLPLNFKGKSIPSQIDLNVDASASEGRIQITRMVATLGRSHFEASGPLKGSKSDQSLMFQSNLSLDQLGQLLAIKAKPGGDVNLTGNARLEENGNFSITGNVRAAGVSFQQGGDRLSGIGLSSEFRANQQSAQLDMIRLSALGGSFEGNVLFSDFNRYQLTGTLTHLSLQQLAQSVGATVPWDGSISGPVKIAGDTRIPGTKSVTAQAQLSVRAAAQGPPLSGHFNASYSGGADDISIRNSYLALPGTRATFSGSLARTLNVALTSRDLNDLLVMVSTETRPRIALNRGHAAFNGTVAGGLHSPRINGSLVVNRLLVEGRPFDSLAADLKASAQGVAVQNARLSRGPMHADLSASAGLRNWQPLSQEPVSADLSLAGGDLGDIIALAGQSPAGYSGALTAMAHISGSFGNPQGTVNVDALQGTVANEVFEQAHIRASLTDQLVQVSTASIQAGSSRIDVAGDFRHPRDSFGNGSINAKLQTSRVDLSQIRSVRESGSAAGGLVDATVSITADLSDHFLLTSVLGTVAAQGLRYQNENYGDLHLNAQTVGQAVNFDANSTFAGSDIRVKGTAQLQNNYPLTASLNLSGLPIERIIHHFSSTPARGVLSGTANINGTFANPAGEVNLDLVRAVIYDQPVDRVQLHGAFLPQSIDISQLQIATAGSQIALSAHYDHPAGNLRQGTVQFKLSPSHLDISRLRYLQKADAGLSGNIQISADGAAKIRDAGPAVLLSALTANVQTTDLMAQGKHLGGLKFSANTTGSNQLTFALDSDAAGSVIHGKGTTILFGDYPLNADLSFSNVTYRKIHDLLGPAAGRVQDFDAIVDGNMSLSGPVLKASQLRGALRLTRVNFTTLPQGRNDKPIQVVNQGPVLATMEGGAVNIQSAHLTAPGTEVQISGSASAAGTLEMNMNGHTDLAILSQFDRDLKTSGTAELAMVIRGTPLSPLLNGQLSLNNASFYYAGVANGLSETNGTLIFNGNSATINNLTAESGGGRIVTTGSIAYYAGAFRLGLSARATSVRIQTEQGVSVVANANLQLNGTSQQSIVSGNAIILRAIYNPRTDIGALLLRAAPPIQAPEESSDLLGNMKLDIRVRSSSSLAVQASMAENLEANIDLRVRGTAAEPGMTGRITVNEGKLVFFGSTYTVNTGTISFYNPVRIDPVLDVSLQTLAQGVDVVVRATGPVDNIKLSYTSNPPLQFQQLVSLLAAGSTPTSDPTLLANQPVQPQQSLQQMGESALLGQAVANPVAGRLQRVFGVSQLKIDPAFQAGSSTPTARVTLQERISGNITFTYTTAVNDPNGEIIKIEWAFSPRWSATAVRDQNGIFSINFLYRRQFR